MNTILLIMKNKRTDLYRSALLFILAAFLVLMAGCTVDDPGYVSISGTPDVTVVDSDGNIITIDEATGAIATIAYEHHEIYEGNSFSCWYEQLVSDTGDKSIIVIKTPNTAQWFHIIPKGSATDIAHAMILEAPVVTDDTGAPLAIFNRNRNSTTISTAIDTSQAPDVIGQATYFTEVTMGNVVGGTEIAYAQLGAAVKLKTTGGGERGVEEWLLKQNTVYAFVIESENDNDNVHSIELNWYEHTNR